MSVTDQEQRQADSHGAKEQVFRFVKRSIDNSEEGGEIYIL